MNISGECGEAEMSALQLAAQAELHSHLRTGPRCEQILNEALEKYPLCIDAIRILLQTVLKANTPEATLDVDSILCTYREYLHFIRPYHEKNFEKYGGQGGETFHLRP